MSAHIFVFAAATCAAVFLTGCGPSIYQQWAVDYQDCLETYAEGVALGVAGSGLTKEQRIKVQACMAERGHPVPEVSAQPR